MASVGLLSDEVPYTAFYARKSYIEKHKDIITKFTKALNKGIDYTFNNEAKIVAKDIINQFPDTKVDELALMIERYKDYDCWLNNPYISEDIFNNLQDFLIDFNLIDKPVSFQNLVNNFYHE